jgi:hypothetical protein
MPQAYTVCHRNVENYVRIFVDLEYCIVTIVQKVVTVRSVDHGHGSHGQTDMPWDLLINRPDWQTMSSLKARFPRCPRSLVVPVSPISFFPSLSFKRPFFTFFSLPILPCSFQRSSSSPSLLVLSLSSQLHMLFIITLFTVVVLLQLEQLYLLRMPLL